MASPMKKAGASAMAKIAPKKSMSQKGTLADAGAKAKADIVSRGTPPQRPSVSPYSGPIFRRRKMNMGG